MSTFTVGPLVCTTLSATTLSATTVTGGNVSSTTNLNAVNTNNPYILVGHDSGNHNFGYLNYSYSGNDNAANGLVLGNGTTGTFEPALILNRTNVTVPSDHTLVISSSTSSSSTSTGALVVTGGMGILGTANIGTLGVSGNANVTGNLVVSGTFNPVNLNPSGNTTLPTSSYNTAPNLYLSGAGAISLGNGILYDSGNNRIGIQGYNGGIVTVYDGIEFRGVGSWQHTVSKDSGISAAYSAVTLSNLFTPGVVTSTGNITGGNVSSTTNLNAVNTNNPYVLLGHDLGNHNFGYLNYSYSGNDNAANGLVLGNGTTGTFEPAISLNRTDVTIPSGHTLQVSDSTASTSTSTGAIVTLGGIGCAGYIHAGGYVSTGGFSSNGSTFFGYSEGSWTPGITSFGNISGTGGATLPTITSLSSGGYYTKIGKQVTLTFYAQFAYTASTFAANWVFMNNIPFAPNATETRSWPWAELDSSKSAWGGATLPYNSQIPTSGSVLNNGSYTFSTSGDLMGFYAGTTNLQFLLTGASGQVISGQITYNSV